MPANPRQYPETAEEVLDQHFTVRNGVMHAMRRFRAARPYQGTLRQRLRKFARLTATLARIYEIDPPNLAVCRVPEMTHASGCYVAESHTIVFINRLSVVTFLHEFRHACGRRSEREACRWSINLFRRAFPDEYRRLTPVGHRLLRVDDTELPAGERITLTPEEVAEEAINAQSDRG
jgi:hypothetical protein